MRAQRYMDTPGNNGFESYSGMVPHKLGRWCKADDVKVLEDRIRALEEAVRVLGAAVEAYSRKATYMMERDAKEKDIRSAMKRVRSNPIAAEACKEKA